MDYNIKRLSDYSEESLVNELKRVAEKLGQNTLTTREYKRYGRTHPTSMISKFGSWNAALKKAGLVITIHRNTSYDDILNEIKRVAGKLHKETLTANEYRKHSKISIHTVRNKFGSWNAALKKAGLLVKNLQNIPNEELFAEIEKVWNQLGRQPKRDEMKLGNYNPSTYERRFRTWIMALEEYAKWKNKGQENIIKNSEETAFNISASQSRKPRASKKVEYGEPIDFLGLRHAPLNEQGVVYLFGVLSRKLGFIIEAVGTGFPDCEGKRQIPGKQGRWEQVAIEFEYKSSNFKTHGHNPDECDVIVCWENDWKDCPVEVISLKELMGKIKE